jgi:hypothetical protein
MIYSFTLILDGEAADTDEFANEVYGDGHDCTLSTSVGVVKAGFDREAASLREAVTSAIRTIHRADPSVRVVGVLTEDQPIDAAFDLASA